MWYVRVGSRVTGPHPMVELIAMRKRGQFGPTNQVSLDNIKWISAKPMCDEIDGVQGEQWKPKPPPAPPSPEWYYTDASRAQIGPVPEETLRNLLVTRKLSRRTLACKAGQDQWDRVDRCSELAGYVPKASVASKGLIAASMGVPCLLVALMCVRQLRNPNDNSMPFVSRTNPSTRPGTLNSIKDESRLRAAIGLVICGSKVIKANGEIFDEPDSTGTSFMISPDGLMLTNAHVVKRAFKRDNMTNDFVFKDYTMELYKPELKKAIIDLIEQKKIPTPSSKEDFERLVDTYTEAFVNDKGLVTQLRSKYKEIQPKVWVFLGSRDSLHEAKVLYVSERHDVAVIKADKCSGVPHFRLATQAEIPSRGTDVFALGFPGTSMTAASDEEQALDRAKKHGRIDSYFHDGDFQYVQTNGSIGKVFNEDAGSRQWVQHNAEINPGNSGGPLVTSDCAVIAINTLYKKGDRDASATLRSIAIPQLTAEFSEFLGKD